jgi:hypothetical protein
MKTLGVFFKSMIAPKTMNHILIRAAIVPTLIILLPLIAMQYSHEVDWSLSDFVFAWVLLFGAIMVFSLLARKMNSLAFRAGMALAVGTSLFLVWANLAVGLIGNEENPANLMYLGVLSVALVGSIIAGFQPRGMSWAMFATAISQSLVAIIALIAGLHLIPGSSITEIIMVNWFFAVLWVVAGALFIEARKEKSVSTPIFGTPISGQGIRKIQINNR